MSPSPSYARSSGAETTTSLEETEATTTQQTGSRAWFISLGAWLQRFWLPVLSFSLMSVAIALTPPRSLTTHARTPLEWVAHYLGHGINSVWVGVSLLLLVVPSLWSYFRHHRRDPWALRALDAIFIDFLCVDALGKDIFKGLGRPGRADQAGFPSGHAMMAFLMAYLVWQRFPRLGPLWFAMAALIGWSRIESHAHFPYQVFVGASLGCLFASLVVQRRTGVLLPRILLSDRAYQARIDTSPSTP